MTQIGVHVWTFEAVKKYEVFPRKLEKMRSRTVLLNGTRFHYQHVLLRNWTLAGSQTEGGATMKHGHALASSVDSVLSDTSLNLARVSEVTWCSCAGRSG